MCSSDLDGISNYSRTKALGEINQNDALTIRTSVVGPQLKDGSELFHWFMKQSGEINGYKKAFWSGITTLELAKGIEWSIYNDINGIYNLTNNKKISNEISEKYNSPYDSNVICFSFISPLLLPKCLRPQSPHYLNTAVTPRTLALGFLARATSRAS